MLTRDRMGTWSHHAYLKASNSGGSDWFGRAAALSADADTLAVGAYGEASNATGLCGNQADDTASQTDAIYLY